MNSIVAKYHYRKRVVRDYYRGLQLFVDVEAEKQRNKKVKNHTSSKTSKSQIIKRKRFKDVGSRFKQGKSMAVMPVTDSKVSITFDSGTGRLNSRSPR